MRRGRAPSREPSGSGGPQWDDPNGQLPGTGIPGDGRRRDASPVGGTVESVGQEGVGVVPERPSLFSTSGSSSFNPFSAALSSLRPEEREQKSTRRVFQMPCKGMRTKRCGGCLQNI